MERSGLNVCILFSIHADLPLSLPTVQAIELNTRENRSVQPVIADSAISVDIRMRDPTAIPDFRASELTEGIPMKSPVKRSRGVKPQEAA